VVFEPEADPDQPGDRQNGRQGSKGHGDGRRNRIKDTVGEIQMDASRIAGERVIGGQ